jgi:Tfp pilus assembly protein PilN
MIQLNLLPDVKLKYLKAQRIRRLAIAVSILISAAAVALLVLLLAVELYQKHTLSDLNGDVASKTSQLQHEPHINDVLTVQNQLQSINSLHASEPATTKIFDYLNELVPTSVTVSSLSIDFGAGTINLAGNAGSINNIDQFVDTLKFTNYSTGSNTPNVPAFSDVILSSYGINNQQQAAGTPGASYSISANFAPTIFNVTKNVSLIIPSQITTRSSLENPGPLFAKSVATHTGTSSSSSSNGGGQ